jgi:flagellin
MSITRINNNVAAINATRSLNSTGTRLSKNIERLSSGLRINRAGDDAAGLTVRERLRTQIRGTDMAVRNAQDGVNMINTAEAALDSMVSSLQRIRELAIQAGNTGTNDIQAIQAIQDEVFQQIDEVNRIATTSRFSSRVLFTGDNANQTLVRAGQDQIGVRISNDPNASNLRSGTSILNIRRTVAGYENLLPHTKADGQALYATGIKDATDIAVTTAQFLDTTGTAAVTTSALSELTFNGVSLNANNMIAFQGVLSDGITPFAGALSVSTNSFSDLMVQIQRAIDNAETAMFGGIAADIPSSFIQTHVSIPAGTASLAEGAGRLRFLSAKVSGTSTTTNANLTDAPSQFDISFNVINNVGDVKTTVVSTRDLVAGQRVGGQYGNTLQAITGSTFASGNFSIEVTDVTPPNRRKVESNLSFRDAAGSIIARSSSVMLAGNVILNGTFINDIYTTGESGILLGENDTIAVQGTNANGSTFETIFTITTTAAHDTDLGDGQVATLDGLINELNMRDLTLGVNGPEIQSGFIDSVMTLTGNGALQLIDDVANFSQTSFFLRVDSSTSTRSLTDRSKLVLDGNPEMATLSVAGGERQRVVIGDEVTLHGPKPTKYGEMTPQLTLRVGAGFRDALAQSIFNQGRDTAEIVAQQFEGTLNGGPVVTFQNGDQDVFFESGVSEGVAETLLLDFDAILDITGPPVDGTTNSGFTILLSTVNNALNFQVGPFRGQDLSINLPNLRGDTLGYGFGSGRTVADINITSVSGVNEALDIIDEALEQISRTRSALGAFTNRLETTVESLSVSSENLQASESRLSDVDLAAETSAFTSNQILFQAGTSVLAQANFLPQGLLSLLG